MYIGQDPFISRISRSRVLVTIDRSIMPRLSIDIFYQLAHLLPSSRDHWSSRRLDRDQKIERESARRSMDVRTHLLTTDESPLMMVQEGGSSSSEAVCHPPHHTPTCSPTHRSARDPRWELACSRPFPSHTPPPSTRSGAFFFVVVVVICTYVCR